MKREIRGRREKRSKANSTEKLGDAGQNSQHTAAETAAASPDVWTPQVSQGSGLSPTLWTGWDGKHNPSWLLI